MATKPTLLILAAGMGSRYNGLKQIESVGPADQCLIEYSIYDALQAGFGKVVFVVRGDFKKIFHERIGRKLQSHIQVEYACQEMDTCLENFLLPVTRIKPWGTGHAVLAAEKAIQTPFAVMNADDHYGRSVLQLILQQLDFITSTNADEYAMVGYELLSTLPQQGVASRGLCQVDTNGYLDDIEEIENIQRLEQHAVYLDENHQRHPLTGHEVVSMNCWGFTPDIFQYLRCLFTEFLHEHGRDDKIEFFLPQAIHTLIKKGQKKVRVQITHESWFGMTHRRDIDQVRLEIQKLIEKGSYPEKLWD